VVWEKIGSHFETPDFRVNGKYMQMERVARFTLSGKMRGKWKVNGIG
jgi:hypothetical protein